MYVKLSSDDVSATIFKKIQSAFNNIYNFKIQVKNNHLDNIANKKVLNAWHLKYDVHLGNIYNYYNVVKKCLSHIIEFLCINVCMYVIAYYSFKSSTKIL